MTDVLIIGCGVIGAAAAMELSKYKLSVTVLERENDVAMGTTKANSAILHAGYDPHPGTLMARLNVRGSELAKYYCEKLDVPYRQCGSMVLAFTRADLDTLDILYDRGMKNGVKGLEIISGDEARKREPELADTVLAALWAPSAAIVSPWEMCLAFAETAVKNGVKIEFNTEVTGLERDGGCWRVTTDRGVREARYVINAAGVDSDTIHDMVAEHDFEVKPSRGQYYLLDKSEGSRVNTVVFQCPSEKGKGVLVSPTVHGTLIVRPNAEPPDKHDTATTAEGLDFVRETAKLSVPGVDFSKSIRNFAGVRANAGRDDFLIRKAAPGFIDLAAICSPGLTSAPAIGEYAAELLGREGLELEEKESFELSRRRIRFKELTDEERRKLVARDPSYGRVICRCETVTEGEILAALRSPVPPCSVDGVKRRVNAGMGRCQGGFCGPRVVELLAKDLGVTPDRIVQDREGMWILKEETKGVPGSV